VTSSGLRLRSPDAFAGTVLHELSPDHGIPAARSPVSVNAVLFDDYGYRELATQVASGKHLLAPA
jgi:hypothetical protein